jgi:hypothetical protein
MEMNGFRAVTFGVPAAQELREGGGGPPKDGFAVANLTPLLNHQEVRALPHG